MLLGEILHRGVITTTLAAADKYQAIAELTGLLVDTKDITLDLREHVIEAIAAREKSAGTGMEQGVALPHGSSDRVENVFGALGISRKGIDFDSLDGLPAKIVLLLVLPRRDFHVHVRTLAGISHLLNEASFRKSLENAKSPDAILKLIRTEEHSSVFDRLRWRKG